MDTFNQFIEAKLIEMSRPWLKKVIESLPLPIKLYLKPKKDNFSILIVAIVIRIKMEL